MSSPDEDHPSDRLVQQRVRNRMIGYFEWVSSYNKQREYQRAVPRVYIPGEVINQWGDFYVDSGNDFYIEPVFSQVEQEAIASYYAVLNWAYDDADISFLVDPSLEDLIGTADWEQLRAAAERALSVFQQRGRLPDDEEIG